MSGTKTMPPWPDSSLHFGMRLSLLDYERALKEAYAARLKVAVAELDRIQQVSKARVEIAGGKYATHHEDYEMWAREALAAIGPLPGEGA